MVRIRDAGTQPAREAEWRRAHDKINTFEKILGDRGVVLVRTRFHINPDEQYRPFQRCRAEADGPCLPPPQTPTVTPD